MTRFIVSAVLLASLNLAAASTTAADVCAQIASSVSSASSVYYALELLGNYAADIEHWASSSTQTSACTVEPGTAADVALILPLLGQTQTPFAVKGGGHTANPGFSSTTGVHISMTRFSDVSYHSSSETVDIGAGLVWDDVYEALGPLGVNVVGGRVSGVGVAGFTLGGGYSWKTNQFGLTVDTVTAFELVFPNGTISSITAQTDPELFFALKGGGNNFGIVTKFTLQTHPQTQVWGGLITYTANVIPAVSAAIANFAANVSDPKAQIIPTFNFLLGQPGVSHLMFYDAPTPPAGIFDEFLAIPHLTEDVGTKDFLSLVTSAPSNATTGARGAFHTVALKNFSPTMMAAIINETVFWGAALTLAGASFVSYDVEPFLSTIYTHSTLPKAFPPDPSNAYIPLNLYYAWAPETSDDVIHNALLSSAAHLTAVALADGQQGVDTAPLYPNYAVAGTELSRLYGSNVPEMQAVKARVDPENVMGLAGGWKL
ncbi:FAD-binding PCMH-type domain-containing protein [Mycena chlorophos]|uniref:FAD-binding PCMH-type domain-containing protein n=1 Tax=Mycena chlorophos TaxID=658473 RepID=A0A8H6TEL7_MYCCL|nr:FAD-binding PCMH-type domain-containing protein [Mycena chlorophos]